MKLYKYIASFFMLIFFVGCEKTLHINFSDDEPKQTINCTFYKNRQLEIYITKSKNIEDESIVEYITDATVDLYENDVYVETLKYKKINEAINSGYYLSEYRTKANNKYKIISKHANFPTVIAEEFLHDTALISSIQLLQYPISNIYEKGLLEFTLNDNINQKNFYIINLYNIINYISYINGLDTIWGEYYHDTKYRISEFPRRNERRDLYLDDKTFNGQAKKIQIEIDVENFEDTNILQEFIHVEIIQVGEGYYNYHLTKSLGNNDFGNNSRTPQSLISNIENGYGVFGARNSKTYKLRAK